MPFPHYFENSSHVQTVSFLEAKEIHLLEWFSVIFKHCLATFLRSMFSRSFVCWSPLSLPLSFAGGLSSFSTFSSLSKSSATSSSEWRNISSLSLVCWPISTGNTEREISSKQPKIKFEFSSCLNPIIYGFMSKSFRQSFLAELRSCCCRNSSSRVLHDPKSQELRRDRHGYADAHTTTRQNGQEGLRINRVEEARPLTVT